MRQIQPGPAAPVERPRAAAVSFQPLPKTRTEDLPEQPQDDQGLDAIWQSITHQARFFYVSNQYRNILCPGCVALHAWTAEECSTPMQPQPAISGAVRRRPELTCRH